MVWYSPIRTRRCLETDLTRNVATQMRYRLISQRLRRTNPPAHGLLRIPWRFYTQCVYYSPGGTVGKYSLVPPRGLKLCRFLQEETWPLWASFQSGKWEEWDKKSSFSMGVRRPAWRRSISESPGELHSTWSSSYFHTHHRSVSFWPSLSLPQVAW